MTDVAMAASLAPGEVADRLIAIKKTPQGEKMTPEQLHLATRYSSLLGISPEIVVTTADRVAKLLADKEMNEAQAWQVTRLALQFKKTPKDVLKLYRGIRTDTQAIAAGLKEAHKASESRHAARGIIDGKSGAELSPETLIGMTEVALKKGTPPAKVIKAYQDILAHENLRNYTDHERVAVLKGLLWKGRKLNEMYAELKSLEEHATKKFGRPIESIPERAAVNAMFVSGIKAKDIIEAIDSQKGSFRDMDPSRQDTVMSTLIYGQGDRDPDLLGAMNSSILPEVWWH